MGVAMVSRTPHKYQYIGIRKLNYYRVEIVLEPGLCSKVGNRYKWQAVDVLAENDSRYCLNDVMFTTVDKGKCSFGPSLNKPNISSHANDRIFGTSVTYVLYSTKKKRKATIKKKIDSYIKSKYGAFFSVDLCFLDA